MGNPSGDTLLTEALDVTSAALAAHKDEPRRRAIIARTSGKPEPPSFGVYEPDPEHVVDRYRIRAHEGRFQVVEHGRLEPAIEWRVSTDELRRCGAGRCIEAPERLEWGWLEPRPAPARTGEWRTGRARRPSRHT